MTNGIKGIGPKHQKLLNDKDVVGLLRKIKEHISNMSHKECECIPASNVLLTFLISQRSKGDPDSLYEKEFLTNYKLLESHWGQLVPSKLPEGESPEDAIKKFKAVMCIRGARKQFKWQGNLQATQGQLHHEGRFPSNHCHG